MIISVGEDKLILNGVRGIWLLSHCRVVVGYQHFAFSVIMDRVSPEEQAHVKKMASDRIRLVLARKGADIDELAKAERNQLLEMMAMHLSNRDALGNTEAGAVAGAPIDDRHLQLLVRIRIAGGGVRMSSRRG